MNFAYPLASDEFDGSAPGPQWSWVRNDASAENVSGGALNIQAQTGDLNAGTNTAKNLLLQAALGDWTAVTKMTLNVTPHSNTQQAGLIAAPETAAFPTVLKALPTASLGITGNTLYLKMVKTALRDLLLDVTLGVPASFGAFQPGVAKDYSASMTADVVSTAGDAALSVADPSSIAPGHLVNGSFSLPSPLLVGGSSLPTVVKTYTAPVTTTCRRSASCSTSAPMTRCGPGATARR